MSSLKLNESPVRTSRNFNINNIKFEDDIPEKIGEFSNLKILQETEKDEIIKDVKFDNFDIKYGVGLISQIKEKSNQNIKINIKSKTDRDIKLEFEFDEKNLNLVENIEIVAEENTKSNIYIIYRQNNNSKAFHNGLIRVKAKSNSKVVINIINFMNDVSNNILSIDNKIEDLAIVKYNIVDFGGKSSITNLYSNLNGKNSNNLINGIYLGKSKNTIDINYIAECFGEKSNINIEVQGALKDSAKKSFKGTIDFKKGCKKATGNENENCMLLSNEAKSIALPMLLCSEEDVEGNHSSSSGKVGDKELFYIMTRGFNKIDAEKLLVRVKFNKILEEISNEELKEEILKKIDERLS